MAIPPISTRALIGVAAITAGGLKLDTKKGASLKLGGTKNNPEVYGSKVYPTAEIVPAELDCDIPSTAQAPIEQLRSMVDAVIVFEGDNGIRYQVSNACVADALELKSGEGIKVKMFGDPAERM